MPLRLCLACKQPHEDDGLQCKTCRTARGETPTPTSAALSPAPPEPEQTIVGIEFSGIYGLTLRQPLLTSVEPHSNGREAQRPTIPSPSKDRGAKRAPPGGDAGAGGPSDSGG